MEDSIAVLDIGTSQTVGLVAHLSDAGIEFKAMAAVPSSGMKRAIVNEIDGLASTVQSALLKLEQQCGEPIHHLTVGVSGHHVLGVNAQGIVPIYPRTRAITREDIHQVLGHSRQIVIEPDREQIQALPREFKIDGTGGIKRPIGMSGGKLEVSSYVLTGQTSALQNLRRAVSQSGREVSQFVVNSLASGLAVLSEDERELGAVSVDIGAGVTDLAIFLGGSLVYSAVIPIGGALVTNDIGILVRTTPEEAERLKLTYGCAVASLTNESEQIEVVQIGQSEPRAMQRRVFCEVIEARMRELVTMVSQHIERSGFKGLLPGGVVITGGGSLLPGVGGLFERMLSPMPVKLGAPDLEGLRGDDFQPRRLATAVGLVRFSLETYNDEIASAGDGDDWRAKFRSLWSLLGGKA